MTGAIFVSLPLMLVSQCAWADNTTGHNALAVAALVAPYAPTLSAADKAVMAALFNGHDRATCFAGDVSINAFSCALKFGKSTITVTGRKVSPR